MRLICSKCANPVGLDDTSCKHCGMEFIAQGSFAPLAMAPSPRAGNEAKTGLAAWLPAPGQGQRNAQQMAAMMQQNRNLLREQYGVGLQAQLQETVVFTGDAKKHVDGLLDRLAVSEKERERLRGELDFTKKMLDRSPKASERGLKAIEENAAIRRELENLKRSTDSDLRDGTARLDRLTFELHGERVKTAFLQKELDRERQKNRKRGL